MVKHNERSAKGALPSWPAPADAQFDIPNVSMGPIVFKQSAAVQNQRGHSAAAAASLASGASGTPCVERWRGPVVDFSLHHLTFWYTLQCCSYGRTNHPRPLSCLRLDGATPEWRIDLFHIPDLCARTAVCARIESDGWWWQLQSSTSLRV